MDAMNQDPREVIRQLNMIGFALIAVLIGGVGVWAATSELSGAVVGHGVLVVESNVKKVQHPTGGIVGEILVRDGSVVEAGQIVMRLDDTVTRATLGIVRSQLDEMIARQSRLTAERDNSDSITFPPDLLARRQEPGVATALAGEEKLFESRRTARHGQRSQLLERITQSNEEIRGQTAQRDAKEREINYISEELVGVTQLYGKNLVSISRLMVLQRDKTRLEGERGQFIAEIARARGRITEIELQILQLDRDFRTEVLKDLRDVEGKLAELRERFVSAEDQLKRVDIRAPQAGTVNQLSVHTVGGVIGNGEIIMQIVPNADALIVEAKIAPNDVDQLVLNAPVSVRIMAGNQRITPEISGVLRHVSADLLREQQTNKMYYLARASLSDADVKKLSDLKLIPGMPAEIFVQTHNRTPLEFLLKPLRDQVARTFRER